MKYTLTLPKPHINQLPILRSPSRYRVVSCGRRFGKTEVAKIALILSLFRQQTSWYAAPTYFLAKQLFEQCLSLVNDVPLIETNKTDLTIKYNKGTSRFVSLHKPDNLRGAGLDFVVIDEAAYVQEGVWERIIQPMLLTTNGRALFLSTPNGRNWFHALFVKGLSDEYDNYQSFQYTSYDNPFINPADLDEIKLSNTDKVFSQEYLARFVETDGSVFRNVKLCINTDYITPSEVIIGADYGRVNDATVYTVLDINTKQVIEILRLVNTSWELQRSHLIALARKYNTIKIMSEENFNDSFTEALANETDLPITRIRTDNNNKQQMINNLAVAFEQGAIGIPDNPILIGELLQYEAKRLPSGRIQYSAPSGGHDDMVMSLALAYYGLNSTAAIETEYALIRI